MSSIRGGNSSSLQDLQDVDERATSGRLVVNSTSWPLRLVRLAGLSFLIKVLRIVLQPVSLLTFPWGG